MEMDWRAAIAAFRPEDEFESLQRAQILSAIDLLGDALLVRHPLMHLTSSAFVLNKDLTRTLMVRHRIMNSWVWPGGHMDDETDPLAVALRETKEETGVDAWPLTEQIAGLQVLAVRPHLRRGVPVSPHLHLNLAFLLIADESAPLRRRPEENDAVAWLEVHRLADWCEKEDLPLWACLTERAKRWAR